MAEFKLDYTANEVNEKLGKIDNLVATINGVAPDANGNVEIEVGESTNSGLTIIDVTQDVKSSSEKGFLFLSSEEAMNALTQCAQNHKTATLTVIVDLSVDGTPTWQETQSMVISLPPAHYDLITTDNYQSIYFCAITPTGTIAEFEYYIDYKGFEVGGRFVSGDWWYDAVDKIVADKGKVYLTY